MNNYTSCRLTVLILSVILIVTGVIGFVYGYELTKNDTDEGRILAICVETDIYLDYCNQIYGGKDYGDKPQ